LPCNQRIELAKTARDHLFSDPALTGDEDGRLDLGRAPSQIHDLAHRRAAGHEARDLSERLAPA